MRDSLEIFKDIGQENRPTFYESVSLGMHLMRKAGWDETTIQTLKGHTGLKMTRHYLEGHDWTTVEIPDSGK